MALVARMSALDCENQSRTGPALVDASRYRYLPLRSKTGSATSLSPSVIGNDCCLSTDQTCADCTCAVLVLV